MQIPATTALTPITPQVRTGVGAATSGSAGAVPGAGAAKAAAASAKVGAASSAGLSGAAAPALSAPSAYDLKPKAPEPGEGVWAAGFAEQFAQRGEQADYGWLHELSPALLGVTRPRVLALLRLRD